MLVDARISASEKNLPVTIYLFKYNSAVQNMLVVHCNDEIVHRRTYKRYYWTFTEGNVHNLGFKLSAGFPTIYDWLSSAIRLKYDYDAQGRRPYGGAARSGSRILPRSSLCTKSKNLVVPFTLESESCWNNFEFIVGHTSHTEWGKINSEVAFKGHLWGSLSYCVYHKICMKSS